MIHVAYPGVPGSFSEQALLQFFTSPVITTNVKQFEEVFMLLKNNIVDYGVLPIENSSTGGIFEVFDFLMEYDFYIVGETFVHVTHHLLGCPGTTLDTIEEVFSHPQGFQQSSRFLKQFPHWKLTAYYNTAISAEHVAQLQDKKKAAVASWRAAQLYNLEIIRQSIQDVDYNYTRFIIIGRQLEIRKQDDKISLIYALPHSVGSLYQSLGIFAEHDINILNLQSRPIKDQPWHCYFYLDIQGNPEQPNVQLALAKIKDSSHYLRILGSYTACPHNGYIS